MVGFRSSSRRIRGSGLQEGTSRRIRGSGLQEGTSRRIRGSGLQEFLLDVILSPGEIPPN
jgi:hypothetical protein